jgi:RNA polymerase sigma-70 factor (ECF subfamily)
MSDEATLTWWSRITFCAPDFPCASLRGAPPLGGDAPAVADHFRGPLASYRRGARIAVRWALLNPSVAARSRWEEAIDGDPARDGVTGPSAETVRLAVAGDPDAFESLVRWFHADLRIHAARMVGDEADDVLQEAYVKAFRAIARYNHDSGRMRGWLFTIVHRTALDHLRSRTRRPVVSMAAERTAMVGPEAATGLKLALEDALDSLSVDHRSVLVLVDAIGLSYDEVAEILGVPRGTIASRLNNARRSAYSSLEASGYDVE